MHIIALSVIYYQTWSYHWPVLQKHIMIVNDASSHQQVMLQIVASLMIIIDETS
jgi:hypothetical protein